MCPYGKILFCSAADSILMPPTIPIASLNRYTPRNPKITQESTWCQQFILQILPKWGDANFCRLEKAIFMCFLKKTQFSSQTVDFRIKHVIHVWKAYASAVNLSYLETILMHPTRRQNMLANCTQLSATSEILTYVA